MAGSDDFSDKVGSFFDTIDSLREAYENNKDVVDGIAGGSNALDLEGREPLSEAHLTDDEVVIVADVGLSGPVKMEVGFEDEKVWFNADGKYFEVDVPDDVVEDTLDASMTNGVLRVSIERAEEQEVDVDIIEQVEEANEDKEEDNGSDKQD